MQQDTYNALKAVQVLLDAEEATSGSLTRAMLGELLERPGSLGIEARVNYGAPFAPADVLGAAAYLQGLRRGRVRSVA